MSIAIPSPLPDASATVAGKVNLTAQTFAGAKTMTQVVTPIVNNTNGTGASDVCVKTGTSVADGSVNTTAKLLSVRTGIGGTEIEKLSVAKSGALTTASSLVMTSDPSAPLSPSGGVSFRANAGVLQASQNGGAYAGFGGVDVTLTAIGTVPNANGASLTGQALNLQPANEVYGGVLNTTSQTIAGVKTFTTTINQSGVDTSMAPGSTTVDAPSGIAAIASGATTCVVTNSLATAYSKVTIEWYGDTGAARSWVVRANGSFTVTLNSAASANTSFGWTVSGITSNMLNGLIHYWTLDGNSNDAFVTGNGTDTAVTYTTPKLGSACAAFNGTTSKVATAISGPLGAAARSISLWAYRTKGGYNVLFDYGTDLTNQRFQSFYDGGTLYMSMVSGSYCGVTLNLNEWTHIVYTYDGTTLSCYRNGAAPVTAVVALNTVAGRLFNIGNYASLYHGGLIDDVVMWDKALDATEVANLYNAGAGLETMSGSLLTNLIHQWHLNGNSNDNVGSANGTDTAITYGGKSGQAAMFNGTTSVITTAVNGPLGAAARSVSMWLKRTKTGDVTALFYGVDTTNGAFEIVYRGGLGWGVFTGYNNFVNQPIGNLNQWYHVVITYDGTTLISYQDGANPISATTTLATQAGPIDIGATHTYGGWFPGLIDEPAMWNRALTAGEVTALYNAGVGKYYPAFT